MRSASARGLVCSTLTVAAVAVCVGAEPAGAATIPVQPGTDSAVLLTLDERGLAAVERCGALLSAAGTGRTFGATTVHAILDGTIRSFERNQATYRLAGALTVSGPGGRLRIGGLTVVWDGPRARLTGTIAGKRRALARFQGDRGRAIPTSFRFTTGLRVTQTMPGAGVLRVQRGLAAEVARVGGRCSPERRRRLAGRPLGSVVIDAGLYEAQLAESLDIRSPVSLADGALGSGVAPRAVRAAAVSASGVGVIALAGELTWFRGDRPGTEVSWTDLAVHVAGGRADLSGRDRAGGERAIFMSGRTTSWERPRPGTRRIEVAVEFTPAGTASIVNALGAAPTVGSSGPALSAQIEVPVG